MQGFVDRFRVSTPSPRQLIKFLSGGNQQKVLLARWLMRGLKVIVVDEPTRGIDVGAKSEIFALLDRLAGEGLAIVMMTSEMPELLGLADRIAVMAEGRITAMIPRRGDPGEDPQCRNRLTPLGSPGSLLPRRRALRTLFRRNEIAAADLAAGRHRLLRDRLRHVLHDAQPRQRARPVGAADDGRHRRRHGLHLWRGRRFGRLARRGGRDPAHRDHERDRSLALGIAGALALGLVVGIVNGYLAAYLGINSLIVTLGTLFILRGGVYLYTGQTAISDDVMLESFFQIGNGRLSA